MRAGGRARPARRPAARLLEIVEFVRVELAELRGRELLAQEERAQGGRLAAVVPAGERAHEYALAQDGRALQTRLSISAVSPGPPHASPGEPDHSLPSPDCGGVLLPGARLLRVEKSQRGEAP